MTEGGPGGLPKPEPVTNPETREFWKATAEGRLLLSHCPGCDAVIWYPRDVCPECHRPGTEWVEASGRGEVYSFAVTRRGQGAYRDATPYVLAYVELAEGPRMLTNIVGCAPEDLEVGRQVTLVFDHTDDGYALPRFKPST